MTSQTGQGIITKHILPNILRSKGNQTMKFGQIIEYNTINTFLEKPSTNHGGEDPFIKKIKINICRAAN